MSGIRIILLSVALATTAVTQDHARGTSAPYDSGLDGVWQVISAIDHIEGGAEAVRYPWGENPAGLVIIRAGHVSIQIMSREAPPKLRDDMSAAEMKAAADRARASFIAYFGPFTVDPTERSLTIHVQGGWRHDYAGTVQKRFYTLEGDRLVIGPAPNMVDGKRVTRRVTMTRVG